MIKVTYIGGIGNQLFQYFAAKRLCSVLDTDLEHDFSLIEMTNSHTDSDIRDFEDLFSSIDKFTPKSKIRYLRTRFLVSLTLRRFPTKFLPRIVTDKNIDMSSKSVENLRMIGYFQTFEYFMEWNKKNSFDPVHLNPSSGLYNSKFSDIHKENFTAVHVRGGDFLQKSNVHTNLGTEYYSEAIEMVKNSKNWTQKLIFFTNDPSHTLKLISSLGLRDVEIFNDNGITAAQLLSIISKADTHITSNSTFSFWATKLSENQSQVYCPNYSRLLESFPKDFYPKLWIQV